MLENLVTDKTKARIYLIIKIILIAVAVRWIYLNINLKTVIQTLSGFSWASCLCAFMSLMVCYVSSAWRWRCILSKYEPVAFSFKQSYLIYICGSFLNNLLPGSFGGDIYRGFSASKFGFTSNSVIQSLVVDRVFGLFFMCAFGLLSFGFFDMNFILMPCFYTVHAVLLSITVGFVGLCYADKIPLPAVIKKHTHSFVQLSAVCRGLIHYKNLKFILICFSVTLFLTLPIYIFAHDLGYDLPLKAVLFVMPMIFLLSSLPISFAGWGVREVAFVNLFKLFGLNSEQSLALSVAYGLISLVSVLPGGIAYFIQTCRPLKHIEM